MYYNKFYLTNSVAVFKHFEGKFNNNVMAQAIASKLYVKEVIPQSIRNKIQREDDDYEANTILYNFMTGQGKYNEARELFQVMIDATAYGKMQELGEDMLHYLETSML